MYIAIGNSIGASSRVNAGGGGGGFNYTYSLAFDGVDDFVSGGDILNFERTDAFSISAWVKRNSINDYQAIVSKMTSSGYYRGYLLNFTLSNVVIFILRNSTVATRFFTVSSTTTITDTNWHNIVVTYDGSSASSGVKIYIDGVSDTVSASGTLTTGTIINSAPFNIGARNSNNMFADGNIDETAIFSSELTPANITSIYNSGVPNDLTSLNPTAWYRNGDNGTWKSPQWLIPNNSNVANSRFSNYSFSYDGVDDKIVVPHNSSLDVVTGNHSLSFWMKANVGTATVVMEKGRGDEFPAFIITNRIYWGGVNAFYGGSTNVNDNNWHHIVFVATGTTSEIFIDGSSVATGGNKVEASANTEPFTIGTDANGNNDFTGLLDEISIFNYALSSSDITSMYNSGVPTDISSLSPISHWRMGEDATFSTNWTVTDNGSASNTGTSVNMTIEDRVGDASNSTSNAVSFNMDEVDRETDVPS